MDAATTLEILLSAERSAGIARSLRGLLQRDGLTDYARLAGEIYLGASTSAETMGGVLGVDVRRA